jgi:hypothetical protein
LRKGGCDAAVLAAERAEHLTASRRPAASGRLPLAALRSGLGLRPSPLGPSKSAQADLEPRPSLAPTFAPEPARPQPCEQLRLVFDGPRSSTGAGTEGCALTGRIGAGEQRSGAGGSPARQRRTGEKALCSGPFRATAESSQPPARSEQRSAPSPQARAAALKPRQGAALGPPRDCHRARPSHASRLARNASGR